MSTIVKAVIVLLVIATLLLGYHALVQVKRVSAAYVYGYPLLLMDKTRQVMQSDNNSSNRLSHVQVFPDHTFRNVVRPNNDTLYSIAWLDLAAEPQVLTVPDTAGRYYVMPLMDAWTNVFAMVGKRTTGTGAAAYLITGPDWQGDAPQGVTRISSPTNMVWLIGRIQTNGREDIPAVAALQAQFGLAPLSKWSQGISNIAAPEVGDTSSSSVDPYAQIEQMKAAEFLDSLGRLMGEQYPLAEDKPVEKMLASIGVLRGQSYSGGRMGALDDYLSNLALRITRAEIKKQLEEGPTRENGWAVQRDTIGDYGTDYGVRAAVAMVGLGALPPAEASYPSTAVDASGEPLMGEHQYQLHFAAGEAPPANAFWSLTLYDQDGFLVGNDIGRYAIGDRDALSFNDDGSVDIYIAHSEPPGKRSNWLPAPKGAFALTLRIYSPKERFLDGSWQLPALQRTDKH